MSVVTFGLHFIYWVLYASEPKGVRLFAWEDPQGGGTSVTVAADRPEYEKLLDAWAREALDAERA